MSLDQILAAAQSTHQSLETIFADTYADMYTNECDNVSRLLYYDLDENKFACKDDENGQYASAFEQQNNVVVIGRVDTDDAFRYSIQERVEIAAGLTTGF